MDTDSIGKTVNMMKSLGPDAQGSMKVTGEIHHSSGFEFTSISSTPDNMSKTSPSHSEGCPDVDEKEGKQANRTSSMEIVNIYRQYNESLSRSKSILDCTLFQVPVYVPVYVILVNLTV